MLIEPVGLELTELYASVPDKKKLKPEKYIIRPKDRKLIKDNGIKSRIKSMQKKIRLQYFS